MSATSKESLRERAEAIFQASAVKSPEELDHLSPEAIQRKLHDLSVHQIELEMQNEELRRTQQERDASLDRYFELYDLAPIGYCTVNETGLIAKANLLTATLLSKPREALVKQTFSRFVFRDDQDRFYLFHKSIFATGKPQSCELRILRNDGTPYWATL